MVRMGQTAAPGEGNSSGESAEVEHGVGRQLGPQGQQQSQQMSEHHGGYQSGGRSGYQFAGGELRPRGQQQSRQIPEYHGGYQSGGRNVYHSGGRSGYQFAGGQPRPQGQQQFQQIPKHHRGYQYAGGQQRPQGQQFQQITEHHGGYQSGGRSGYQSGRRGGHMGGRGGGMAPQLSQPPQPQQYYRGLENQQRCRIPQQFPRVGATTQAGPSRPRSSDLHQGKLPFGSPTESLGDDISPAPQLHPRGDNKPQPQGGRSPYGGPTSLSPDLHQATSPYQSAPSTSKAPFGSPIKSLSSANASQQWSSSQKLVPASSTDMTFPLRPGGGTRGRECTVTANHFFVQFPDKDLHQYDVTIIPEVISQVLNRAVIKKLEKLYKQSQLRGRLPVYDGRKSLYTAGPLPFVLEDFKITLDDEAGSNQGAGDNAGARKREFTVKIKLVARIDLCKGQKTDVPQEALQALDIVLRELPTSKYVPYGRSFFSLHFGSKKPFILGEGLECWPGYFQSIRPTQMGLSLNIDVSFTAFIEPLTVIEYVAQLLKRDLSSSQPLSDGDHVKIKKALRGIRIEVTHRGEMRRKYRISGLTSQATRELTFPVDERGTLKSVVEHFRETYNSIIHYTWLPCLNVGNQRPIYLPMEVCKIVPGQRYSKKLNKEQISNLLRNTCKQPDERMKTIYETVRKIDYANDEYANEFGLDINPVMAQVPARILPAPQLKYHDSGMEKGCLPRDGVWSMKNKKMVNGGEVKHWICLNFAFNVNDNNARRFCQELAKICSDSGMIFSLDPVMPPKRARLNQLESALKDSFHDARARLEGKELDLLIVILPEKNCPIYGDLKRICETELGLVSQCCSAENVLKDRSKQYQCLVNLSLKINVKVGGRNTVLADALSRCIRNISNCPTIIFGADVTHPQPGDFESPSIAAVVASQDWPEITKYASLASAQAHRQEIIEELFTSYEDPNKGTVTGGMIKDLLVSFRTANGCLPEKIIFYRDGVSEGQFNQVLLYEVSAIKKACASLEPKYEPRITFVVVQKRHHTRLFPSNKFVADKSGNIQAGTVVDREICHPTQFDFFLCSHAGIKGTSRPAHYHILWDENEFSADDLQTLTYDLCYTYARCTRSVSIVPPAYYAHLAAFRARCYIESETSDSGSVGSRASRAPPGANVNVKQLPALMENVRKGMFFC